MRELRLQAAGLAVEVAAKGGAGRGDVGKVTGEVARAEGQVGIGGRHGEEEEGEEEEDGLDEAEMRRKEKNRRKKEKKREKKSKGKEVAVE